VSEQAGETHELSLADIVVDPAFQVRRHLSQSAVRNYAARYKTDATMPPLRVARITGGALVLVDGWHRVAALKSIGRARATVEIVETTERGAQWEAAKANLCHGVQLRNGEYREVFRAFVKARQARKANGKLKSYREIAQEIGGTKSYNTIRNWTLKDFPKLAAAMAAGDTEGAPGGLRDLERMHPEDTLLASGVRGAENAAAAARGIKDPVKRGRLVESIRRALHSAETDGPVNPTEDDF
jgi:hypothetical protein